MMFCNQLFTLVLLALSLTLVTCRAPSPTTVEPTSTVAPETLDASYPPKDVRKGDDNDGGEDDLLCQSRVQYVYPKTVKNKDDGIESFLNTDKYKQGVRVEICSNPGKPCISSSNPAALPDNYTSVCVQKFEPRVLSVLDSGLIGGVTAKPFVFPSSCSCSLRMNPSDQSDSLSGDAGATPHDPTRR